MVLEVDPRFQYSPEALNGIYVNSSAAQEVPLSTLVNSSDHGGPDRDQPSGHVPGDDHLVQSDAGVALGDAVGAIQQIEQESGKPASLVTTFQGNAKAFLPRSRASRS